MSYSNGNSATQIPLLDCRDAVKQSLRRIVLGTGRRVHYCLVGFPFKIEVMMRIREKYINNDSTILRLWKSRNRNMNSDEIFEYQIYYS